MAAVARQKLSNDPVAARVKVREGDFFADPIPEDHDLVLLANVVHLLAPERTLDLLHRTRERVRDGARLLLVDFWTDATHTQPLFSALMAGAFLVDTGVGDVYSEDEARQWLAQSGWEALERKELAGPVESHRCGSPRTVFSLTPDGTDGPSSFMQTRGQCRPAVHQHVRRFLA